MSNINEVSVRHFGSLAIAMKARTLNIYDCLPDPSHLKFGKNDDPDLRKEIFKNGGLTEPIIVTRHSESGGKYEIIDGEKRWQTYKFLVKNEHDNRFTKIPAQVTDRILTNEDKLRVFTVIHMTRKDWAAKYKEQLAKRLVEIVGDIKAAEILGLTFKQITRLKEIYELSTRISNVKNDGIPFAREIMNLPAYLHSSMMVNAIIGIINEGYVTSPRQIRDLRRTLKKAKMEGTFRRDEVNIDKLKEILSCNENYSSDKNLFLDLTQFNRRISSYTWIKMIELRGNAKVIEKINECKRNLSRIQKLLAK
jgi:ParB family chromosome partitioning protein